MKKNKKLMLKNENGSGTCTHINVNVCKVSAVKSEENVLELKCNWQTY